MRLFALSLFGMSLLACTATAPSQPARAVLLSELPGALETIARTGVIAPVGSAPGIEVSVTIRNRAALRVQFVVLAVCPISIQLYADANNAAAVYDESMFPCVRSGRIIELNPSESVVLRRLVPADSVRSLPAGRYRVIATVTSGSDAVNVSAGVIDLPLDGPR